MLVSHAAGTCKWTLQLLQQKTAQEAHKVMERHRRQQWLSSGQHRQHY